MKIDKITLRPYISKCNAYVCEITDALNDVYLPEVEKYKKKIISIDSTRENCNFEWYLEKACPECYTIDQQSIHDRELLKYNIKFMGANGDLILGHILIGKSGRIETLSFFAYNIHKLFSATVETEEIIKDHSKDLIAKYRDALVQLRKSTTIISVFPGCLLNNSEYYKIRQNYRVNDLIEAHIDESGKSAYLGCIRDSIGVDDKIFVNSDSNIRQLLHDNGIPFAVVYPGVKLKNEIVGKYYLSQRDEKFISDILDNWNDMIDDIEKSFFNCKLFRFDTAGESDITLDNLNEIISVMDKK